jgi:hypothetical protein
MNNPLKNIEILVPCNFVELVPSQFIRIDTWPSSSFCLLGRAPKKYDEPPYSVFGGTTLADNEETRRHNAVHAAAATVLSNGQIILFRGLTFKVVVIRGNEKAPRNSDPVRFVLV